MSVQYVTALRESLEKKLRVLDEIFRISQVQSELLRQKPMDYAAFDRYVADKDVCIEKLEKLDEGFEMLYQRVGAELKIHKSVYAHEIQRMQELISQITDRSMAIQALEQRNKQGIEQIFLEERRNLGKGKRSVSVAQHYYNNMNHTEVISSHFMDQKQ